MARAYDHQEVESRWQQIWADQKTYNVDLKTAENPYYNLMMFPYPSAEGLHVGNFFAFTGADIHGRFRKAQGFDVFEPMGFDAFGIHSENHALKVGTHPWNLIPRNVAYFKEQQLQKMGAMFDWAHEVDTTDPGYYKWTQWIFQQLYRHGLAYRQEGLLNWCPSCKTVLSNEQVAGGICERCDSEVTKKKLPQWFFRITSYCQELLDNLAWIDWSERTKDAQRRWIGRSTGAEIYFGLDGFDDGVTVFTTRPDTLFVATYMVLAPEHPLIEKITTDDCRNAVSDYVNETLRKSEREREAEEREKTGVFTGCYAVNPVNGAKVPVWISDYVLMAYGTGAIMAVPAHDTRDFAFAKKYGLPMIQVISPDGSGHELEEAFTAEGLMLNSSEFNGLESREALKRITDWCEKRKLGKGTVNYRLRDWGISRQRYWGPPVPVIHCDDCGIVLVPEEELPVKLPYIEDFKPLGTGESPLATVSDFVAVSCPNCGKAAKRDCDVMDNFLDSAWYFFRYLAAADDRQALDRDLTRKWLPVDMYIGGNEHAVLHLMYTRFITMAFKDMGLIDFAEPFKKFRAHGLIVKEGAKMSKSKGNIVNPDEYITNYGADTLRMYLMFLGPFTEGGDFRDSGISGIQRFLDRVWRLGERADLTDKAALSKEQLQLVHRTIKKVTEDLERLSYHTAEAALMEYVNALQQWQVLPQEAFETLLKLLQPFAPHIAHEIYRKLGHDELITAAGWPVWDEQYCAVDQVEFVFMVNGKLRGTSLQPVAAGEDQLLQAALEDKGVTKFLEGREIVRKVLVPGKLLNIVVK